MQPSIQKRYQKKFKLLWDDFSTDCILQVPAQLLELVLMIREDPDLQMDQLLDIVAQDGGLCEMTYIFQSTRFDVRMRIKFKTEFCDHIPSITMVYSAANWLEREIFDLFGLEFDGHPNLKRLILYPEFAGHPLRKNYPADKAQALVPIYA